MADLYTIAGGELRLHLHPGQWRAWQSTKRFVAVIAGTQSGKTSWMPLWLWREIQVRGPGDYAIICPTFSLLEKKAFPEFLKFFDRVMQLGTYVTSPVRKFVFSEAGARRMFGSASDTPTQIFFGYAENSDSLESATYKGIVCDEAGQKAFKRESWEALLRRLSIHQGRALITTTPYSAGGWLRTEIVDKAGGPDVDLINFPSFANPSFPHEEYERAKRDLPAWKFDLFYKGLLTRPAGLIYDSFNEATQKVPRFALPTHWKRYLGLDFGGVNTAALFYAEEPTTRKLYLYREYKAGGRTAAQHATALLAGEPMVPRCVGGSHSEGQWRSEFRSGGLPVEEPDIKDVEIGINRVYGAHKRDEIMVFADCTGYLDQKTSYSRVVNAEGVMTEAIEDKSTYHFMDAERYIIGKIRSGSAPPQPISGGQRTVLTTGYSPLRRG